jgi:hypothetical protein
MIKRLKEIQKYCKRLSDGIKRVGAKVDITADDLREV